MPEFRKFKEFILQKAKDTEFDVATGDFGNLVVQPAEGFHYFYDKAERRLIKSFVLRDGPQVDTMCDVVVIEKDGGMEPRLHFWKKDKTKGNVGKDAYEAIEANEQAVLVKASVDVGDTRGSSSRSCSPSRVCHCRRMTSASRTQATPNFSMR